MRRLNFKVLNKRGVSAVTPISCEKQLCVVSGLVRRYQLELNRWAEIRKINALYQINPCFYISTSMNGISEVFSFCTSDLGTLKTDKNKFNCYMVPVLAEIDP